MTLLTNSKKEISLAQIENKVLGILFTFEQSIAYITENVLPVYFEVLENRNLFSEILKMKKEGIPINIMAITLEIRKRNLMTAVGGLSKVSELSNDTTFQDAENVQFYCNILKEEYIRKKLIGEALNIFNSASDRSVQISDIVTSMAVIMKSVEKGLFNDKDLATSELIESALKEMNEAKMRKGFLGFSTGTKLDNFLCGIQPGTVYVVAARPGMGKSAFVKTIVVNLAKQQIGCKVFSLEVKATKFVMNMFSDILEVENTEIFKGNITEHQTEKIRQEMKLLSPYFEIDDKPAITIQYLERKVKLAVEKGMKVIVIDYLQLMEVNKGDVDAKNREQQVAYLTKNIKRIAAEYNVAIIELSQLSRAVEEREDKRPGLSDLRESGAIEQDAEVIMFLFRPEYYKIYKDKSGNDLRGLAQVIIAKNRNGSLGDCPLRFIPQYTKFIDYEEEESIQSTLSLEDTNDEIHM